MPVERCKKDGKPGFRWGSKGKCYTFVVSNERSKKLARAKAAKQGRAIKRSQSMRGGDMESDTIKKIFGARLLGAVEVNNGDGGQPDQELRGWIEYLWHDWDAWLDSDHKWFPQFVKDVEKIVWQNIQDLQGQEQEITRTIVQKLMQTAINQRPFTSAELAIYWGGEEKIPPSALEAFRVVDNKQSHEVRPGQGLEITE